MSSVDVSSSGERAAAVHGARAMIAEAQFEALVMLLIELRICPPDRADRMLSDLAGRLSESAHSRWFASKWEIALHIEWLKGLGTKLWAINS